ncbi:MAG: DUF6067 family protein [bacterium]|nr:DUF6067 family protein [bacterium]
MGEQKAKTCRAVVMGIAVIVCGCRFPSLAWGEGQIAVWVTHGTTRVFPQDPPGEQREARIFAARNEFEPFQVVVRGEGGPLEGVTLEASALKSDGGGVLDSKHITLFREHYVYIRRPSYRCNTSPGLYPDGLIPFLNPLDGKEIQPRREDAVAEGAKYDAVPCTVYPGFNQPFWVDVFVPPETPPGEYRGTVTVKARGEQPVPVPVRLTVWDLTLPETPTVKSHFGGFNRVLRWFDAESGSDRAKAIERRFCEMMAQHRITPDVPSDLYPRVGDDGNIVPGATHEALKEYMTSLHVNAFPMRFSAFRDPLGKDREKNKRFLSSTYEYLKENGWADGAYVYILDEPNDAEAYEEVRKGAAHVHEANPKIKVLCTEQTKTSNPEWGDLYGAVDIWVPLWPLHDEETAAERLSKGEELWSYTALCQGKGEPLWWQMDLPVLNYRMALWTNYRYHIVGLLYWTTVYWEQVRDPWLDQPSFRLAFNGEGELLYPGKDAGFDGPVSSIRLKNIREGMEDYEYFALLEKALGREEVEKEVLTVTRGWWDWERSPEVLLAARQRIAAKIKSAAGK